MTSPSITLSPSVFPVIDSRTRAQKRQCNFGLLVNVTAGYYHSDGSHTWTVVDAGTILALESLDSKDSTQYFAELSDGTEVLVPVSDAEEWE